MSKRLFFAASLCLVAILAAGVTLGASNKVLLSPKLLGGPSDAIPIKGGESHFPNTLGADYLIYYDTGAETFMLGELHDGDTMLVWFQSPAACTLLEIHYCLGNAGDYDVFAADAPDTIDWLNDYEEYHGGSTPGPRPIDTPWDDDQGRTTVGGWDTLEVLSRPDVGTNVFVGGYVLRSDGVPRPVIDAGIDPPYHTLMERPVSNGPRGWYSSWHHVYIRALVSLYESLPIYDLQYQETNRISIPLTNFGQFGQNVAGSAGDDWPKGSGNPYIFGAGIWVAAILDGDTIVINGYNTVGSGQEFMPGPHYDPNPPEDKVYLSWDPDDLANWPDRDSLGEPIILGDEDTWAEFNGHDPEEQGSGEKPLPISVTRHSVAWRESLREDMIFFMYTIKNDTTFPITNMYVGIGSDLDIGDHENDLVGLDRRRSLGYTFTSVQEVGWEAPPPYYCGYAFLSGPKASDTVYVGQDPANPDTIILPGEHLVLTAFKEFNRSVDATNDVQRFLVMAGYDFNYQYGPFTDSLDTEPGDKRMVVSAGPFELEPGEVDTFAMAVLYSNGNTGGLWYLQNEADRAKTIWDSGLNLHGVRVISPNGGEVWSGVHDVEWSTSRSSGNPLLIDIGVSPDRRLSLDTIVVGEVDDSSYTWNTSTVPDGFYFLQVIGCNELGCGYDWSNGEFVIDNPGNGPPYVGLTSPDGGEVWGGVQQITWWARDPDGDTLYIDLHYSNDNGLTWMEIASSEPNDSVFEWDTSRFPNGLNSCMVKVIASDMTLTDIDISAGSFTVNNSHSPGGQVDHTAGTCNTITITPRVVRPEDVTGDLYEVRFETIYPDSTEPNNAIYTYDVWDLTIDSLILDDYPLPVPLDSTPVVRFSSYFDGVSLQIEAVINSASFSADSITVTVDPGVPYPQGNLSVEGIVPEKIWAFHGATSFEIRWEYYNGSPDTLTAQIHDVGNDSGVPFDSLWADSWSFGPRFLVPPLVYDEYMTADMGVPRTMIYVCGVKYYTNDGFPMNWSVRPEPGEIWTVYQSGDCPPCRGNTYQFTTTGINEYSKVLYPPIFRLFQNRPNPFSAATTIRYSIVSAEAKVSLKVYDVAGRLVNTIVDGKQNPGHYTLTWDGRNEKGQSVSSGIYFYRLSSGGQVATRKMVLMK